MELLKGPVFFLSSTTSSPTPLAQQMENLLGGSGVLSAATMMQIPNGHIVSPQVWVEMGEEKALLLLKPAFGRVDVQVGRAGRYDMVV